MPSSESRRSALTVCAAAALVGALLWRLVLLLHEHRLGEYAAEASSVLDGRSFSPAFANRLLGPGLLRAVIATTGVAADDALSAMILVLLVATFVTWAALAQRLTGRADLAFRSVLFSALAFALFLDPLYLKVWDFTEFLIFTVFAWGVLARARMSFFAIVFAIALPNRESALFIAAWLVIAGLGVRALGEDARRLRRARMTLGVALGMGGFAFVVWVRRFLWVGTPDASALTPWGNHLQLIENVRLVAADARAMNYESLYLLALLAMPVWLARGRRHLDLDTAALALVLLVIVAANLCFATATEARTWMVCLPIVVALDLHFLRAATDASLDARRERAAQP